jgi:hypothetical protein
MAEKSVVDKLVSGGATNAVVDKPMQWQGSQCRAGGAFPQMSKPMAPPAVGDVNSNISLATPIIPLATPAIQREVEIN